MDFLLKLLPSTGTIVVVIVVLYVVNRILERREAAIAGRRFGDQVLMLSLTAVGALLIILVLPIGDTMRGQLLSLIGILLTAAIALSSTTILGNAMAGMMLKVVRNFHMGDFIRTGEHFGRVSERGLFHTEIQTQDRELTTLPNLYLVTHPVSTIRKSGTIVSATVSLGYDVGRSRIEKLLLDAAQRIELGDPFVQVLGLGDFSVTYRIAGMLTEVKQVLTTQSRLRCAVLDVLHEGGVEIVSPNFMNQRVLPLEQRFIPRRSLAVPEPEAAATPEDVVFDKADEAETLESIRLNWKSVREQVEEQTKVLAEMPEGPEREKLAAELAALEARKARLEKIIESREKRVADGD